MPAKKTEETNVTKNTRFYSQFMKTPQEAQRSFNNGSFSGTDINPMFRIQKLTEVFGPTGFGWWTQNVRYDFVEAKETNEVSVFCELDLYVKDPETGEVSQPIYGIGGNTYIKQWKSGPKASDEAKKMAYTDALSIACKALGIGHDIWYSNDRTKYTMYESEPAPTPKKETKPKADPEPEAKSHTEDTAAIIEQIKTRLDVIGEKMDKDAKIEFAKNTIYPVLGTMNYKSCTDIEKLIILRDKLNAA